MSRNPCLSLPADLLEQFAKTFSLSGVDHLHEADSSFEMCSKIVMGIAILSLRPFAYAIGEYRLKAIEVSTQDVRMLIGNQTY